MPEVRKETRAGASFTGEVFAVQTVSVKGWLWISSQYAAVVEPVPAVSCAKTR